MSHQVSQSRVGPIFRIAPLASCIFLASAALADCPGAADTRIPKGQWFLHWENDLLTRFASDEYFTNGVRVGYSWDPGCERRWVRREAEWLEGTWLGRTLALGDADANTRSATFAIGQSIYTPSDIKQTQLQPDDHPYAGWLYASTRLDYTAPARGDGGGTRTTQQSFELQTGIVGPGAGGKEVQTLIHEVMDDKNPEGWSHQLHNEPGIDLMYQWQQRHQNDARTFDLTPSVGTSVGNVHTYAALGLTLRLGRNLTGFPSRSFEPSRVGRGELRDHHEKCFGMHLISQCHAFVGGEVRYVARNIFLDGNTFRDSPRVDRRPFVREWNAGFKLRMPSWHLTFTYMYVWRSTEFDPVPATSRHADGHHEYGLASFSWDTHFD